MPLSITLDPSIRPKSCSSGVHRFLPRKLTDSMQPEYSFRGCVDRVIFSFDHLIEVSFDRLDDVKYKVSSDLFYFFARPESQSNLRCVRIRAHHDRLANTLPMHVYRVIFALPHLDTLHIQSSDVCWYHDLISLIAALSLRQLEIGCVDSTATIYHSAWLEPLFQPTAVIRHTLQTLVLHLSSTYQRVDDRQLLVRLSSLPVLRDLRFIDCTLALHWPDADRPKDTTSFSSLEILRFTGRFLRRDRDEYRMLADLAGFSEFMPKLRRVEIYEAGAKESNEVSIQDHVAAGSGLPFEIRRIWNATVPSAKLDVSTIRTRQLK